MKEHSIEVPGLLFSVSFGFLAKIVARRLRQRFSLATHTQCLWLRCAGLVGLLGLLFLCSLVETTWGQPVLAPSEPTSAPRPEQDAAALAPPGVASSADANLLSDLTAREHPWGRFQPKSWIHTQAISRTTVPGQPGSTRIVSIRETKTTLESVDLDGVTLKTESTLGVGGKQIKSAPLTERFDFFQQPITGDVVVRNAGTGKLLVNQLVIPCKKRVYEKKNATEKLTTTLWFSTQLYPYVLRAETVLTALPTENEPMEFELRRTIFEVYESSAFLPRKSKEGAYRYRMRTTEGKMTTLTEASCSRFVPGGVHHETVKAFDAEGAEIRTTETRLINFFPAMSGDAPATVLSPDASQYPYPPVPFRPRWRRQFMSPYPIHFPQPAAPYIPQSEPTLAPPQGGL